MRLIDADAMVQRLEERLKELDKEGVHIAAKDGNGFFDILIDHLRLDSEIRTLREWINKQPTIEAEPVRRGKWLTEYGDHIRAGLRPMFICCSECGMVTTVKWNYCPICGARMEDAE